MAAFVILADRYTKHLAITQLDPSQTIDVIPGFIDILLHRNYGAMANVPVPIFIIASVTIIVIAALSHALWKSFRQEHLVHAMAYTCIISGALSNLYDRLHYGYVIDWLLLLGRSVVNIADIAITIGIVIYLFSQARKKKPDIVLTPPAHSP
ncbi:MAG: signal peptidase II [Candidatus Uhrbacteria bacterium]|nr:signal peptidase II [Candidatus Uhrbacteria bacterium]